MTVQERFVLRVTAQELVARVRACCHSRSGASQRDCHASLLPERRFLYGHLGRRDFLAAGVCQLGWASGFAGTLIPASGRYASLQCELGSGCMIGGKIHKYPNGSSGLLFSQSLCVMAAKMRVQDQSLDSPMTWALWMSLSTI